MLLHNGQGRLSRLTVAMTAAAFLLVSGGPKATALAADKKPKNLVYVQTNDPSGNAILAYYRAADGSLTQIPGSPFPTGGTGIMPTFALGPFDSDQEIITNPDHTLLFATNGGSDTIAVFDIAQNGSLRHVKGSPFPSGGSNPVSLGLAGNILCVVNKDNDPSHPGRYLPDYTTLRVHPNGKLTAIPRGTVYETLGSDPTQALISPDGNLMFGADFLGGILRSFAIESNGRLTPKAVMPLPVSQFAGTGKPPLPLGLAVHPTKPLLYVGFVTLNRIGVYHYTDDGSLRFLRTVPDSGGAVCWLLLNKAGTRLYASNTGDLSVSVFDVSRNPSMPIEIQKIDLRLTGVKSGGFQFALDPSERFLVVVAQQDSATSTVEANAIHVLNVDRDGLLSEVESSPTLVPVPNLVRPQGIVAF